MSSSGAGSAIEAAKRYVDEAMPSFTLTRTEHYEQHDGIHEFTLVIRSEAGVDHTMEVTVEETESGYSVTSAELGEPL